TFPVLQVGPPLRVPLLALPDISLAVVPVVSLSCQWPTIAAWVGGAATITRRTSAQRARNADMECRFMGNGDLGYVPEMGTQPARPLPVGPKEQSAKRTIIRSG